MNETSHFSHTGYFAKLRFYIAYRRQGSLKRKQGQKTIKFRFSSNFFDQFKIEDSGCGRIPKHID